MIDKRKTAILFPLLTLLVVISGVAITALAATEQETTNTTTATAIGPVTMMSGPNGMLGGGMGHGMGRGMGRGGCGMVSIEVSEEFKANVVSIAERDSDVQNLLAQGYNVTGIRPLITSVVEGDGVVTSKASGAIVMLTSQDGMSHAAVLVDLNAGSVTRIEVVTRTVIDKSQTSSVTTSIGA
jgi:hypothetical protein